MRVSKQTVCMCGVCACFAVCSALIVVFASLFGWSYSSWQADRRHEEEECKAAVHKLPFLSPGCHPDSVFCLYTSGKISYNSALTSHPCHSVWFAKYPNHKEASAGQRLDDATVMSTLKPCRLTVPTTTFSVCEGTSSAFKVDGIKLSVCPPASCTTNPGRELEGTNVVGPCDTGSPWYGCITKDKTYLSSKNYKCRGYSGKVMVSSLESKEIDSGTWKDWYWSYCGNGREF